MSTYAKLNLDKWYFLYMTKEILVAYQMFTKEKLPWEMVSRLQWSKNKKYLCTNAFYKDRFSHEHHSIWIVLNFWRFAEKANNIYSTEKLHNVFKKEKKILFGASTISNYKTISLQWKNTNKYIFGTTFFMIHKNIS